VDRCDDSDEQDHRESQTDELFFGRLHGSSLSNAGA
jgi:hypothetical protein